MMKNIIVFSCVFLLLAVFVTPSLAVVGQPKTGHFWATLEGSPSDWNVLNSDPILSGGDGYTSSGPWYPYSAPAGSQTDAWGVSNPVPGWHNQWWYDDPYDPLRWKEVRITFNASLNNIEARGGGIITLNWTTGNWTDELAPPMDNGPPAAPYIGRQVVAEFWRPAGDPSILTFDQTFDLRDWGVNYNPVWISVDIAGYNLQLSDNTNPGSITHTCVPEPSAFLLMLVGGCMLMAVRFFRR